MAKGRFRLNESVKQVNRIKQDILETVPATLGVTIGGEQRVQVPNREGYVYARIRGNLSELVQAYNDRVSAVYDLPVVLVRDKLVKTRWKVQERDLGRYDNWGSSPYLPFHGATHSFNPNAPGADPVWVYGRQIMPLAVVPSGSAGGPDVIIQQGVFQDSNDDWLFVGGTGTADLLPSYKPTGSSARMVLVYLDDAGNPNLLGGTTYFAESITGTSSVFDYVPDLPSTDDVALAAIRLVSGTSVISWSNIYDMRLHGIGGGGGGGLSGLTGNRIVITDPTGVGATDEYLTVTGSTAMFGVDTFPRDGSTSVTPDVFSSVFGSQNGGIPIGIFGNPSDFYPAIYTYAYNGTEISPTAVTNGNYLFELYGWGMDNTGEWRDGFDIFALAGENWSNTANGTVLYFDIINTGSTALTDALILRAFEARFRRDVVLTQTGTSAAYYFGDPYTNNSYRLTQKSDTVATQRRVNGVWTDVSLGGHIIQDDGVSQTQRPNLNFVGPNFVLYDDAVNGSTIVSGTNAVGGFRAFVGEMLLDQTVGVGGQASFSISNIPSGYNQLQILYNGRTESTGTSGNDLILLAINGDTANSHYLRQSLTGYGLTEEASGGSDRYIISSANSYSTGTRSSQSVITINDPGGSNLKTAAGIGMSDESGYRSVSFWGLNWQSPAAITSLSLTPNSGYKFAQGTRCVAIGYKQQFIGSMLSGSGSANSVAVWDAWNSLTKSSLIYDDGNSVTIGGYPGVTGSVAQFSRDGTFRLYGSGTAWDDLRVSVFEKGGVTDPTWDVFNTDGAGSRGVRLPNFTDQIVAGNEKELFFQVQMPHSWLEGSTISPHVHWQPDSTGTASGQDVRWGLEYNWTNIGAEVGNTSFLYTTGTVQGDTVLVKKHYLSTFGDVSGTGKTLSSILNCRIFRNSSSAADSFPGGGGLLSFDIHYQVDGLGSRNRFTK